MDEGAVFSCSKGSFNPNIFLHLEDQQCYLLEALRNLTDFRMRSVFPNIPISEP